jgi:hypothetical protein
MFDNFYHFFQHKMDFSNFSHNQIKAYLHPQCLKVATCQEKEIVLYYIVIMTTTTNIKIIRISFKIVQSF